MTKSSGKPTGTGKGKGKPQKPAPPRFQLTLDQWLDIVGYVLLAVAGLTILSFLSANHGLVPGWWLGMLRRAFGWGTYLVPLFVGAVGLWLVLRDFGDRLPRVTPQQVVGVLLGYLALLSTVHLLATGLHVRGQPAGDCRGRRRRRVPGRRRWGAGRCGRARRRGGRGRAGHLVVDRRRASPRGHSRGRRAGSPICVGLAAGRPRRLRPSPTFPRPSLREPPDGALAPPYHPLLAVVGGCPWTSVCPSSRCFGSGQAWRFRRSTTSNWRCRIQRRDLRQQSRIIEETLESLGAPVRSRRSIRAPVVTESRRAALLGGADGREAQGSRSA